MDSDFEFAGASLDLIIEQFSGNSLKDRIVKYLMGPVVQSKLNRIIIVEQIESHRREKISGELDKFLDELESGEITPDLGTNEMLKGLSQLKVYSPNYFTIENSWVNHLVKQETNSELLNLGPRMREVEQGEERDVINQLLGNSQWILTDHFSQGHSPTRVYLARRFEEGELHVLKVGRAPVIQAEWEQFHQSEHWCSLPKTAQLKNWFIAPDNSVGGLNYELAGGYEDSVETLGQYFSKKISSLESGRIQAKEVNRHFESVINRALQCAHSPWDHHWPKRFSPAHTFDRMLPVNLELKVFLEKSRRPVFCPINAASEFTDVSWLPTNRYITLHNFIVEEIKPMNSYLEVTLNVPASRRLLKEEPEKFRSHRIRLQVPLTETQKYYEGQEIKQITGEIIETRLTRFGRELSQLPDLENFNLATKQIKVHSLGAFPNPFIILGRVLQDYLSKDRDVFVAEIHGDFHWHNIMVDREDGHLLAFVDLAQVRYDYILHDFLKLELSLITGLLKHPKRGGVLDNAIQLYKALDQAWKNNRDYEIMILAKELQPLGLAILKIRQEVAPFLRSRDHKEYYAGLLVYLLSSLKFKSLDTAGKLAAFGAALVVGQLTAQLFENTKDK